MHHRILFTGIGVHLQILEVPVVLVDPPGEGADRLLGHSEARRALGATGLHPPEPIIEFPEKSGQRVISAGYRYCTQWWLVMVIGGVFVSRMDYAVGVKKGDLESRVLLPRSVGGPAGTGTLVNRDVP